MARYHGKHLLVVLLWLLHSIVICKCRTSRTGLWGVTKAAASLGPSEAPSSAGQPEPQPHSKKKKIKKVTKRKKETSGGDSSKVPRHKEEYPPKPIGTATSHTSSTGSSVSAEHKTKKTRVKIIKKKRDKTSEISLPAIPSKSSEKTGGVTRTRKNKRVKNPRRPRNTEPATELPSSRPTAPEKKHYKTKKHKIKKVQRRKAEKTVTVKKKQQDTFSTTEKRELTRRRIPSSKKTHKVKKAKKRKLHKAPLPKLATTIPQQVSAKVVKKDEKPAIIKQSEARIERGAKPSTDATKKTRKVRKPKRRKVHKPETRTASTSSQKTALSRDDTQPAATIVSDATFTHPKPGDSTEAEINATSTPTENVDFFSKTGNATTADVKPAVINVTIRTAVADHTVDTIEANATEDKTSSLNETDQNTQAIDRLDSSTAREVSNHASGAEQSATESSNAPYAPQNHDNSFYEDIDTDYGDYLGLTDESDKSDSDQDGDKANMAENHSDPVSAMDSLEKVKNTTTFSKTETEVESPKINSAATLGITHLDDVVQGTELRLAEKLGEAEGTLSGSGDRSSVSIACDIESEGNGKIKQSSNDDEPVTVPDPGEGLNDSHDEKCAEGSTDNGQHKVETKDSRVQPQNNEGAVASVATPIDSDTVKQKAVEMEGIRKGCSGSTESDGDETSDEYEESNDSDTADANKKPSCTTPQLPLDMQQEGSFIVESNEEDDQRGEGDNGNDKVDQGSPRAQQDLDNEAMKEESLDSAKHSAKHVLITDSETVAQHVSVESSGGDETGDAHGTESSNDDGETTEADDESSDENEETNDEIGNDIEAEGVVSIEISLDPSQTEERKDEESGLSRRSVDVAEGKKEMGPSEDASNQSIEEEEHASVTLLQSTNDVNEPNEEDASNDNDKNDIASTRQIAANTLEESLESESILSPIHGLTSNTTSCETEKYNATVTAMNVSTKFSNENGNTSNSNSTNSMSLDHQTGVTRWERDLAQPKVDLSDLAKSLDTKDDIYVSVVTWNLAEESPQEQDAKFIKDFRKHGVDGKGSDVVLISGQECENIKPRRTEGRRSREFRRLMVHLLGKRYVPIAIHQLGGIQFGLFCRRSILGDVQSVSVADVTCGIGNVFHNKGAIAAFLQLKARNTGEESHSKEKSLKLLFVTAHMAAHVKNSEARDADFWRVMTELEAQAPHSFVNQMSGEEKSGGTKLLEAADRLFFCGDLNYRLDLPREVAEYSVQKMEEYVSKGDDESVALANKLRSELLMHDQLQSTIAARRAFIGLAEGPIAFAPTFKYDKDTGDFDTSHKQRIPAWTDRILFKPFGTRVIEYTSVPEAQHSDHRPVVATFRVNTEGRTQPERPAQKRRTRKEQRRSSKTTKKATQNVSGKTKSKTKPKTRRKKK